MDLATAEAAAERLLQHRRASALAGTPTTHTPRPASEILAGPLAPANAGDAYAIQDALIRRLGPVIGWKVGGKGSDTPNCAPIWPNLLHDEATAPVFAAKGVDYECEIAYVFARGLPGSGAPYARDAVLAAIGSTHVGMELLTPRFDPPTDAAGALVLLADGLLCGGYVLGAPVPGYRRVDCTTQRVRVEADGPAVIDHAGGIPVPELEPLLVWLANHLAARGLSIKAGDVVTTGSWMGKRAVGDDREVCTRFESVGEVVARFSR